MKYIIPINLFLLESLSPEHKSFYSSVNDKRSPQVKERLSNFLDGEDRVYIPLQKTKRVITKTQLKVTDYLAELGYEISSYIRGIATSKDGREIRIGKLLGRSNPELLMQFNMDPSRVQAKDEEKDKMVVITSNYEDVAGMSCNRKNWKSCMDINTGLYKSYLERDVIFGTMIAYYTTTDDVEIEEPLGRLNIKPYYLKKKYPEFFIDPKVIKNEDIIFYPDKQVYGNVPVDVVDMIRDWVIDRQVFNKEGFYSKLPGLYSDFGSPTNVYVDKKGVPFLGREFDDDGYDIHGYNIGGYDKDGYDNGGHKS